MQFEFSTTSRIIFGSGKLNAVGDIAAQFGKNAFIVSGCPNSIVERLYSSLETRGIRYLTVKIKQEPTIDLIQTYINIAKQFSPDMLIGLGGGSAIDTAKAIAVLISNPGEITDYLEVIGLGKSISNPSIPIIAIPTTSGTGAEVTKNAVLASIQYYIKVSLRSPYLLPRVALVDPELTLSVPPATTAFTGLDALTQLIEPYTCIDPNPITDILCRDGIQRIGQSIYQAYDNGVDPIAREDMSIASLFSGIALANAKLGAVHGLAATIGGEIPAPHGAICACLLPHTMETNISALMERAPDHQALKRYDSIAKILTNQPSATAEEGVQWVRNFCNHAKIPPLSVYGLSEADLGRIAEKAMRASSMKGNPIILSEVEIRYILLHSLK
jgi:alcohol dehydrogenase class IV